MSRENKLLEQIKLMKAQLGTDDEEFSDPIDFTDSSDDEDLLGIDEINSSDCDSVVSFQLSPVKVKPVEKRSKPKGSRIPLPRSGNPKANRNSKQIPQNTRINYHVLARDIPEPLPLPDQPSNFLAPKFSNYSNVCIAIFEGTDFPRAPRGERNTYIVANLHPELSEITTPVSWSHTNGAVYNGGFDLNCIGISFDRSIPVITAYDYISQDKRELLGFACIQLNLAKTTENICIVLNNEWVDLVNPNTRLNAGRVRMSLIFHNGENLEKFMKPVEKDVPLPEPDVHYPQHSEEEQQVEAQQKVETVATQVQVIPEKNGNENQQFMANLGDFSPVKQPIPLKSFVFKNEEDDEKPIKQKAEPKARFVPAEADDLDPSLLPTPKLPVPKLKVPKKLTPARNDSSLASPLDQIPACEVTPKPTPSYRKRFAQYDDFF